MNNFQSFQTYLDRMGNASNENDKKLIKQEFDKFFGKLDAKAKKEFTQFQINIAEKIKVDMLTIISESETIIYSHGRSYSLSQWITPVAYCQLYGIKLATISNKIRRRTFPFDAYVELPELNGLKLINKNYFFQV